MVEILEQVEIDLETDPQAIITLERNRGWLSLVGHIEQRRAAKERILLGVVMRGDDPVDQREVDYLRGYFDALGWMTSLPRRMRTKVKEEHAE